MEHFVRARLKMICVVNNGFAIIHPSHGTFCTRLVWCPGGDYIAKQKSFHHPLPFFINHLLKEDFVFSIVCCGSVTSPTLRMI